jgi:hypothetical protein
LDYTNHKWIHADLSRQEFARLADKDHGTKLDGVSRPLWQITFPESSSTAAEAVAALIIGPPTLAYSNRYLKRRLFTNLFLPGESLAFALRTILWWTVPAPELSIILLDWSSLLQGGSNPSALSQVALPILKSLIKAEISQMKRLLFGQVLVSSKNGIQRLDALPGSSSKDSEASAWSLLITTRNDHALKVLQRTLDKSKIQSVALLYGSSHCPDLHQKLVSMGFRSTKTSWRTAWSVLGSNDHNGDERAGATILPALVAFLVFYLVIGALDWVGMLSDASRALENADYFDAAAETSLYLVRHVLLYLGLSKFLVDWTGTDSTTLST